MPREQETITSDFYCCKCGSRGIPILRRSGKKHEPGHLKKLYCIKCKQEWNFAEICQFGNYTYDDFLIEFHYGNFDEQGNRILPYKQFIAETRERVGDDNHE